MLKIDRGAIFDTLRLKAKGQKKYSSKFCTSVTRNSPLIDHTSTVRSLKLLEATRKEAIRTEGQALTNSANPCYWVFYLSCLSLLRFSNFDWIKQKRSEHWPLYCPMIRSITPSPFKLCMRIVLNSRWNVWKSLEKFADNISFNACQSCKVSFNDPLFYFFNDFAFFKKKK